MKAIKSASTWDFKLVVFLHIFLQRFYSICAEREFPETPCESVCFELVFRKHRLSPNFAGVLLLHIIYLYVRLRGVKVVCVFIVLSYYS
jgi:hypothetical protein